MLTNDQECNYEGTVVISPHPFLIRLFGSLLWICHIVRIGKLFKQTPISHFSPKSRKMSPNLKTEVGDVFCVYVQLMRNEAKTNTYCIPAFILPFINEKIK